MLYPLSYGGSGGPRLPHLTRTAALEPGRS